MIVSFPCPSGPEPVGGVNVIYEFANGLARRGHRVILLHAPFWGRSIESLDDIAWFPFEPDVEHLLFPDTDISSAPVADIIFGTGATSDKGLPVLLVQGLDIISESVERQAMQTPCLRVCVASWLAEAGERFGIPREQFVTVPLGIDHDLFRVIEPVEDRPRRVAMPFNDHVSKGAHAGLRALELVREHHPDLEALVFHRRPPERPLPDWVTFLHAPSQAELVERVYNRSRLFVLPSFHEGFGLTAIEAMACGCALVTTDNGGSRDYAIDGETALVVEPDEWGRTLVEPILRLLGDDRLRRRLADQGRRYVRRFDWDRAAEVLEGHLERYLADPSAYGVTGRSAPIATHDR